MKNTILLLLGALLLACAGADVEPEGEVIGTLEQAVYQPAGYGIEGLNAAECNGHPDCGRQCSGSQPSDFAGGRCVVPDDKTIRFKWYPSTCPNANWQEQMFQAIEHWISELAFVGWVVVEGTSSDYTFKCEAVSGSPAGRFQPGPSWDHLSAWYGTLSQHKNGKIQIDTADIDAWVNSVAPGSEAARNRGRRNFAKHELYHLVGLGHDTAGAGNSLMAEQPNGTWVTSEKTPAGAQMSMLDCYNHVNGGLFDDC